MSNRVSATYHGYFLWVERLSSGQYKTWIIGPAAVERGAYPPLRTLMKETPEICPHRSITDAKAHVTARVRSEYLSYLNPEDDPAWNEAE